MSILHPMDQKNLKGKMKQYLMPFGFIIVRSMDNLCCCILKWFKFWHFEIVHIWIYKNYHLVRTYIMKFDHIVSRLHAIKVLSIPMAI